MSVIMIREEKKQTAVMEQFISSSVYVYRELKYHEINKFPIALFDNASENK